MMPSWNWDWNEARMNFRHDITNQPWRVRLGFALVYLRAYRCAWTCWLLGHRRDISPWNDVHCVRCGAVDQWS